MKNENKKLGMQDIVWLWEMNEFGWIWCEWMLTWQIERDGVIWFGCWRWSYRGMKVQTHRKLKCIYLVPCGLSQGQGTRWCDLQTWYIDLAMEILWTRLYNPMGIPNKSFLSKKVQHGMSWRSPQRWANGYK